MRQLSLFTDEAQSPAPVLPEEDSPPAGGGAAQLDLFSQRILQLGLTSEAIAAGRLDEAGRRLAALQARWPADPDLRGRAAQVAALERRLRGAQTLPDAARAPALLAVVRDLPPADGPWDALRAVLLRRVAEALGASEGEDAALEGQPPGYYLLEAGAVAEARTSLAAAVAVRRRPRALYLLADATALLGEPGAARHLYLEALLRDPFDPALAAARDDAVRALPDVARDELDIEDEPTAWSAPVGIVTGVLPRPAAPGACSPAEAAPPCAPRSPLQQQALDRARRFVEALTAASAHAQRRDGEGVIEARRTMKRLAPTLFAEYLRRVIQP